MDTYRTPKPAFANLPEFPWKPHYVEVKAEDGAAARMAWVEAGDEDAPPVLLLHGEPSWSFLYRKMIPILVDAGYRAIAPDLIGFGRSDKPSSVDDYTYQRHVDWVRSFVEQLELSDVRMICQDWGGLIGLRLLGEHPGWFAGVVATNTFLPTGEQSLGKAFERWRAFTQKVPEFPISGAVNSGTATELSDEVLAAYDAPFPEESYKAGARVFPALVPTEPDDPGAAENREAWKTLENLGVPFLVCFGDSDPITGPAAKLLHQRVGGAEWHEPLENASHFIQEDAGEALAEIAVEFFGR
jgi:haloalkane dehalogenase